MKETEKAVISLEDRLMEKAAEHYGYVVGTPPAPDPRVVMLKSYQKVLRLQDWDLTLRDAEQDEMDADTWGKTIPKPTFKEATIVLRPGLEQKDLKRTLLHELVHLLFAGIIPGDAGSLPYFLFETGIDNVARALEGQL